MATSTIVTRGNQRVKLRPVAPGEVEFSIVGVLQFIATASLVLAPPQWLRGNGTALLLMTDYPHLTSIARSAWALVFFSAGMLCVQAVTRPSIMTRKLAWQVVIPLWACWLAGLFYPLVVGLDTNVISLSAVSCLVTQWLVTRLLVPLDSFWYSREVPVDELNEGNVGVDDYPGSRA